MVGNRPQIVNHVMRLKEAGCERITVVVSPDTKTQVANMLRRCGLNSFVSVTEQPVARGPVDALKCGIESPHIDIHAPTYVVFSDTVIDEPLPTSGDWTGVFTPSYPSERPDIAGRSWCYVAGPGKKPYVDAVPPSNEPITIGVSRFMETTRLYLDATRVLLNAFSNPVLEVPMSALLNEYHPFSHKEFSTWLDVGDVKSIAQARKTRFTTRAHHTLTVHPGGNLISKTGVRMQELDFYEKLGERGMDVETLFPTLFDSDRTLSRYTMEFVDLPTLAELWLYWPGLPGTWRDIVQALVDRLMHTLWQKGSGEDDPSISAGDWMMFKARRRLVQWGSVETDIVMLHELADIVDEDVWVPGHGDLNFTNIMYSINTGAFKLIDPRGGMVPLIYELGKIAYSHIFSAVTHGLFLTLPNGHWILPQRTEEYQAVVDVLTKYADEDRLTATMALILLAAPPLHKSDEAKVFYDLGMQMAKDVLS